MLLSSLPLVHTSVITRIILDYIPQMIIASRSFSYPQTAPELDVCLLASLFKNPPLSSLPLAYTPSLVLDMSSRPSFFLLPPFSPCSSRGSLLIEALRLPSFQVKFFYEDNLFSWLGTIAFRENFSKETPGPPSKNPLSFLIPGLEEFS